MVVGLRCTSILTQRDGKPRVLERASKKNPENRENLYFQLGDQAEYFIKCSKIAYRIVA